MAAIRMIKKWSYLVTINFPPSLTPKPGNYFFTINIDLSIM